VKHYLPAYCLGSILGTFIFHWVKDHDWTTATVKSVVCIIAFGIVWLAASIRDRLIKKGKETA
jgi:formate hydrogenlyase subunit 4